MKTTTRRAAIAAVGLLLVALLGATAYLFTQGTFADITSEDDFTFVTNPGSSCFYSVGSQMTFYGNDVSIDNFRSETVSEGSTQLQNPDEAYARIHYGDTSKLVYDGQDTYTIDDLTFEIKQRDAQYVFSGTYCGQYRHAKQSIYNIIWEVNVDVPKDRITVDVGEIVIEDTAPGEKSLTANVTITNDWRPFDADRVYAEAFDTELQLDAGRIDTGSHTYDVTIQNNWYDAGTFLFRENVSDELVVQFENPRVPTAFVSGNPDRDGNLETVEQFGAEHGGIPLNDMQSVPRSFSTTVTYCGENASYVGGECVIDEQLHLRSDLCPLLENQQIVSQDITSGTTVTADALDPEPLFFCTKHPVLVTDPAGQQTKLITEPYTDLVRGESVTVPEGETWRLYWTIDKTGVDTSIVCEEGTYNKEEDTCKVTPGITHVCRDDAVWNPQEGACVVTPETKTICEQGRYEADIDKCVYNPPVTVDCDRGSCNPDTEKCVYTPETQVDCEQGTYSADLEKCLYEPGVEETCDTGEYNSTTEMCEVTAPVEQVCEQGEYNAQDGTCEYEPPVEHICSRGYFDASRELCLAEGTVETVCTENATLQDGTCKVQPRLVKQTPLEQLWLGVQRTLAKYMVYFVYVGGSLVVVGGTVLWIRRRR